MKQEPKSIFTSQRALVNPAAAAPDGQPLRRASIITPRQDLLNTATDPLDKGSEDNERRLEHKSGDTQGKWERGGPPDESVKKAGVDTFQHPPIEDTGQEDLAPVDHVTRPKPTYKRPRPVSDDSSLSTVEPPLKKPRKRPKPRHTLDPATFPTGFATSAPLSPLFFSNSQRERPPLPARFSSSQAGVTMLNKSRDESSASSITTLKLARGSISSSSPPRAMSTPGSWISHRGRGSTPMSPEAVLDLDAQQILSGFGIIEFLEQDERPTFIIDLSNTANFMPGSLHIMFANASLRAYDTVLEMILGRADLDSPGVVVTNTFPEFKAWLTSFVKNNQSMDVCLPSFLYGGVTWTCSTLKKRLRVVSGKSNSLVPPISGSGSGSNSTSASLLGVGSSRKMKAPRGSLKEAAEPPDYFGDAFSNMDEPGDKLSSGLSESPAFDEGMVGSSSSGLDQIPAHLMRERPLDDRSMTISSVSQLLKRSYTSSFDWTRLPMSPTLPKHIQFARSIDWAATSLGPIEDWGYDLRAMANMVMGSPHPAAMYWGKEYVAIYNEAYILLAGNKHPTLMGQSYKVAWAEIWEDQIEGVFREAWESGQATMKDDDCLFITRNGFLEEAYFSWSIVPLVGENGQIGGLYNPAFEKTRRKIAERRMLTLREVGEKVAIAKDVKEFWGQVCNALEYNEYDVPFLYLYSVSDESDSDLSSMYSGSLAPNPQAVLEGTRGVPDNHPSRTSPLDLRTSNQGWAPYLRDAMKKDTPVLLSMDTDSGLSELIVGLENRSFGDACRSAVVCPIYPTTGEGSSVLGFFIMGVNPRRPYDDDYSLFIQLLSRQLATSMASVVLFEEEIRRGQRAARLAALDRIELSKQLDLRTQEARESETKFTRMAEFAPVGMFIANSHGHIIYSNDTWFRLLNSSDNWVASIMDEDREEVKSIWTKVIKDKQSITHEFRVKTPWQDRNGNRGDTWVLMSAYPEKDSEGGLKSVFGSLTEISSQKWAESYQKRRMEEAMEMKRQQENFIDMTSHEIRNPTSVILQCADEITSTLSKHRKTNGLSQQTIDILDSSTDAAQTIALCSLHQKRIVDDILTLSKLDSALLLVTPVDVQPIAAIQGALNMFKGELESNEIALEFQVEDSFTELSIDWVKLDPSRLLQVLINLITNAIKFTHSQEKRTIIVSMGASMKPLSEAEVLSVSYFPTRSKREDITQGYDWGTGEELYLYFAVQDTGQGLDEDEKKLLFNRFSQASPRTHVQYGGSGLGLFISRELTELQGGEIGVASERGVGSTFAFYIKSRRANPPLNASSPSSTKLNRNSTGKSVVSIIDSRKNSSGKHASHKKDTIVVKSQESESEVFKVLIVEDNLVNQRVLQKQLRNLQCVTRVANHGGEALEILKESNFWKGNEQSGFDLTVVLMDLEMPIMDGLTCAKRIRELEADGTIVRHVPIIAVTANARAEQIGMALSAGMDDVVSKPFRIPELISKIEELVQINSEEKRA